jgi:putative spermidine/putrescine transport system permease protein
LANYQQLLVSAPVHRMVATTLRICVVTTVLAVALGYVVAYALVHAGPRTRRWLFLGVVLPLWISVLVRAFAWVTLLRREGVLNSLLIDSGLVAQPLDLLWNEFAVCVGMVHYMVPYAVLPLYAAMRDIDQRLVAAARGLGATRGQAFRRVFLPLSRAGIVGAGVLVFIFSLGFFVTPAILGGGKTLMIADYIRVQIMDVLRWGPGTALSTGLVAAVFATLWLVGRVVDLRKLLGARS